MEDKHSYYVLLKEVHDAEHEDSLERMRAAYTAFLDVYPLCFGFWKRYAEQEVRHGSIALADAVYEKSLVLGHHCVELWSFYTAHAAAHWSVTEDVRKLFERAAALVGTDYGASVFWDRYISYETGQAAREVGGDMSRVAAIYRRVLKLPLKVVEAYWIRFQQLAAERTSTEVIDDATEVELRAELECEDKLSAAPPQGEDEGARKLRVMPLIESSFKRAKAANAARVALEATIRRRHFHMKPLDPAEFEHWGRYLDWEEANGDQSSTISTYERCLIPCCQSLELWRRYTNYLLTRGERELARAALARASGSFLRECVEMVLYHAAFEEAHGQLDDARRLCRAAAALRPPRLEALLAQVNLERRAGELHGVRTVYASGIELLNGEALTFFVRHGARFERRIDPVGEHAVELIEHGLAREPHSESMWGVLIEHETARLERTPLRMSFGPMGDDEPVTVQADDEEKQRISQSLQRVCDIFERALDPSSPLPPDAQQRLWRRYIQFASDYMPSIQTPMSLTERARSGKAAGQKRTRTQEGDTGNHVHSHASVADVPPSATIPHYPHNPAYPGYASDYAYNQPPYPTHYTAQSYGQHNQYGYGYQYGASYEANYVQYGQY